MSDEEQRRAIEEAQRRAAEEEARRRAAEEQARVREAEERAEREANKALLGGGDPPKYPSDETE